MDPGHLLRRRVLVCLAGCGVALALLLARVLYLDTLRSGPLQQAAAQVRLRVIPVLPRRGMITDRNGVPLALSVDRPTIYANPAQVRDPAAVARALASVLDRPAATIEQRLRRRTMFVWIARQATLAQARAVQELRLPGIHLTQEGRRIYPQGPLAAQVLGFAGIDGQGLAGVEKSYDRVLRGKPGRIEVEYDARNQPLPIGTQNYVPPTPGDGIELTIDARLQGIAERDLAQTVIQHGARGGFLALMDPATGELLALATYPSFDPNRYAAFDPARWRNPFISDTLSPGSVFKPITAAAALNDGLVTPDTPFYDPGFYRVPGAVIHDAPGGALGGTTFRMGFAKSANVVFVQVGLRVGTERFYRYLDLFGLRAPTGIDLPGEARGIFPNPARVKPVDLAVMSFGQTLTVTPVAMLAALGAIANGGELMWPHVAKAILAPDGSVLRPIEPRVVRRVISERTAATIRRLMLGVTQFGTGKNGRLLGYDVGGKTGTTNKVVGGRVSSDAFIASFAGMVPVAHPSLVAYIAIDEPQGAHYGGQVAAPLFRRFMTDALRYLQVPPERPREVRRVDEGTVPVPSLLNLGRDQAAARAAAAGLTLQILGGGPHVRAQAPEPGAAVIPGTLVLAYTTSPPSPGVIPVTVPDLRGLSFAQAAELLGRLDLQLDAGGPGPMVTAQDPAPGTTVESASVVRVQLPGAQGP